VSFGFADLGNAEVEDLHQQPTVVVAGEENVVGL
jgi:hypothetical protein